MIAVPPFDVDALRQIADIYEYPPEDLAERERQWRTLVADLQAAADHIELCQAALAERKP